MSIFFGCAKKQSGILEDLEYYPYAKNEVYSLNKDFFVCSQEACSLL